MNTNELEQDETLRILQMMLVIGKAYRSGGIVVTDTLPRKQQAEVRAVLDRLVGFYGLANQRKKRHEQTIG